MLGPNEQQRTIDSFELGIFNELYRVHGDQEVPAILRALESTTPGERVVLDQDGKLIFGGLVYARTQYLPTSINVTKWKPNEPELATVSLPLSHFVSHSDLWGTLITGGGMNRQWANVCKLTLLPDSVDESDLAGKVLSIGSASINRRLQNITDDRTRIAMRLVLEAS